MQINLRLCHQQWHKKPAHQPCSSDRILQRGVSSVTENFRGECHQWQNTSEGSIISDRILQRGVSSSSVSILQRGVSSVAEYFRGECHD